MFPELIVSNTFDTIDYDANMNTIIEYTINNVLRLWQYRN